MSQEDLVDFDDGDFVEEIVQTAAAGSSKDPPTSSTYKRKSVTPTSSKQGGSKKKKKDEGDSDDDQEEEGQDEITFRFCKNDSDEDDEEEGPFMSKKEWMMVESKENGTKYSKGPPTNPNHRYINRRIDIRADKPTPSWWKITKALQTGKRMSDKPEDKSDNKLRKFYCELGKEEVEEMDVGSQQSTTSELTPLTPEVIKVEDLKLTSDMRKRAEDKIKAAGADGLAIPGTISRVAFKPPDTNRSGRFFRPWGLFGTMPIGGTAGTKWICSVEHNCVTVTGTRMEEYPKCSIHKGGKLGFVLGQFTDSANKKNEVVLHIIASFTYIEGDEKGKEDNATAEMNKQLAATSDKCWSIYRKERAALNKPTPELFELKGRRRYFDDEDELMKMYSARQTTTLFRMLLWPDTTTRIICLNQMINFPNGAYKELVDEMNFYGLELRIHDKIQRDVAKDLNFGPELQIPFILTPEPDETLGSLLSRGNEIKGTRDKGKTEADKVAALYFVASPFVMYGGQALSPAVHSSITKTDPVIDYKTSKGDHPEPLIVPIGIVPEAERYKWEFVIHICALMASLLRLPNSINPGKYKGQAHPFCINRQTNCTFMDKKSWGIIHSYMLKNFFVDIYLGPKRDDN